LRENHLPRILAAVSHPQIYATVQETTRATYVGNVRRDLKLKQAGAVLLHRSGLELFIY